MARSLAEFIGTFVVPLHDGDEIRIAHPYTLRDREQMVLDAGALADGELRLARLRRAQAFVALDDVPDPTHQELSGWLGLYNVLALDHPEADRVWTRDSTWEMATRVTASLLADAVPVELDGMLMRHVAVDAMLQARRVDVVARIGEGERRYAGTGVPRAVRRLAGAGQAEVYEETVTWVDQPHSARAEALLPMVMRSSPLTSLVQPRRAERGWDPAAAAGFLRRPAFARAVVYAWARGRDWVAVGGEVTARLVRAVRASTAGITTTVGGHDPVWTEILEDEAAEHTVGAGSRNVALPPPPIDAADAAALLGALIHLHVLRVLAFDARVALAGHRRRGRMRAFLALPLVLPGLRGVLGDPLAGVDDPAFLRRWDEYLEGLRGIVPPTWVEDLGRTLAEPIVEGLAA